MLDESWRKSRGVLFEFVAIAKEAREVVVLRIDDPHESEYKEVIYAYLSRQIRITYPNGFNFSA
jgi:hypothetical protein